MPPHKINCELALRVIHHHIGCHFYLWKTEYREMSTQSLANLITAPCQASKSCPRLELRQVKDKSPIGARLVTAPLVKLLGGQKLAVFVLRWTAVLHQFTEYRCWRKKLIAFTNRHACCCEIYLLASLSFHLISSPIHSIDPSLRLSSSNEQHHRASHGGAATAPVFPFYHGAANLRAQYSFSAASRVHLWSRMRRHLWNHIWHHSADEALDGRQRGFNSALVCALWLHPSLF